MCNGCTLAADVDLKIYFMSVIQNITDLKKEKTVAQFPLHGAEGVEVTGSDALILSLLNEGVDTIFGYPGGAIMPIYDALYNYADKVKHILVRHEQGAIHAAQGYARVSGRPGIAFATSGPGAT